MAARTRLGAAAVLADAGRVGKAATSSRTAENYPDSAAEALRAGRGSPVPPPWWEVQVEGFRSAWAASHRSTSDMR